jgi:hypothetical protein
MPERQEDRQQDGNWVWVVLALLVIWYLRPQLAAAIPEVEMPGKTPQFETWTT